MMACRPFLMAGALALVCGAVTADPANLEEARATITSTQANIETYAADTETTMNMSGIQMRYTGTTQGKGDLARTVTNLDLMGQKMSFLSVLDADGVMWTETNVLGELQVMKADMSQLGDMADTAPFPNFMGMGSEMGPSNPTGLIDQYAKMYDLEFVGVDTVNDEPVYVISGTLNAEMREQFEEFAETMDQDTPMPMLNMASMMNEIQMTFSVDDGFPRTISVVAADGAPFVEQAYRNVQLNVALDDELFQYTPPEGADVMDLMSDEFEADATGGDSAYNTKFSVGDNAPDFTAETLDGETLTLSDYHGKIVMLDFWATWCGPCVQEMPNVIDAYEKFHPKGLAIIGVSLDDSADSVRAFLKERPGMKWPQVFDGKGWDSEVGVLYGVDAIPFTLLLDKDGTIIGKDLRGEALHAKLDELLGGETEE